MKRPSSAGSTVTTPHTAMMIELLGGVTSGQVALSSDEMRRIQKLYGFVKEKPHARPAPPVTPKAEDFTRYEYEAAVRKHEDALRAHANWNDPRALMQAGADRNALRFAERDGLRLVAWLSQFLAPGEDPLKALVKLAADGGYDVDHLDVAWAEDGEDEGPPEPVMVVARGVAGVVPR